MTEKTCKYCRKEIPVEATKCPYCREWLNKTELSTKNPYFWTVVFIVSAFGISKYFQIHFQNKMMSSNLFKEPVTYRIGHKLKILPGRLIKEKTSHRVISEIKNDEAFTWESVTILAVFEDKEGKPIYLGSAYLSDLKPHEKRPFQINSPCSEEGISLENFKGFTLQIETASAKPWRELKNK